MHISAYTQLFALNRYVGTSAALKQQSLRCHLIVQVRYRTCVGLAGWRSSACRWTSWLTLVVDVSTGDSTTDTALHDCWSSVPCSHSKNLVAWSAVRSSDVCLQTFKTKLKTHLFSSFPELIVNCLWCHRHSSYSEFYCIVLSGMYKHRFQHGLQCGMHV